MELIESFLQQQKIIETWADYYSIALKLNLNEMIMFSPF